MVLMAPLGQADAIKTVTDMVRLAPAAKRRSRVIAGTISSLAAETI